MRLFFADAVCKACLDFYNEKNQGEECRYCILKEVPAFTLDDLRAHGRWDDSGKYKFVNGDLAIRCSECGCSLRQGEYEKFHWNYCPVCGAKMDQHE